MAVTIDKKTNTCVVIGPEGKKGCANEGTTECFGCAIYSGMGLGKKNKYRQV